MVRSFLGDCKKQTIQNATHVSLIATSIFIGIGAIAYYQRHKKITSRQVQYDQNNFPGYVESSNLEGVRRAVKAGV